MIQKQCIKEGETKNLMYQLSWIYSKDVYSKGLHGGLCKVGVLFEQDSGLKPRGKFVKTVFNSLVAGLFK